MIMVRCYWSEDGVSEICSYEEFTTNTEVRCDHCDTLITKGETAVRLGNDESLYVLHKACAKESITFMK